jgi:hypothetical protein
MDNRKIETVVKDRPYALSVLQTQILYDMASMLEEAIKLLTKPKGKVYPIKITVERMTILDFINGYPHTPLFSILSLGS